MNKTPILIGVFLTTSLAMVGVQNLVPALPAIAKALQLEKGDIAYLITAFTLGNVLVAPFLAILVDRIGRRKVLLPSLCVFGVAGTFCGLVDSADWVLFFRFLQGMGSAALGAISVTILTDLYSGPDRIRWFGYNMSITSLGMVIFPLAGGFLVQYSWRYPFFLAAAALPVALYNYIYLRYPEPLGQLNVKQYLQNFSRSLHDPRILRLAVLNLSVFILFGGVIVTFFALLIEDGFPADITLGSLTIDSQLFSGLAIALFALMVGVASARLGAIHTRFGFSRVLALAVLGYGVALLGVQAASTPAGVLASMMVLGCAHGITVPSIVALHTKLAPEGMIAAYVTMNSLVFRIGQTLGPVLMALVYSSWGLLPVFWLGAAMAIPMALLAGLTRWR
ncbi:MAG: MFS transporter [Pseudomonadales bacterium]